MLEAAAFVLGGIVVLFFVTICLIPFLVFVGAVLMIPFTMFVMMVEAFKANLNRNDERK